MRTVLVGVFGLFVLVAQGATGAAQAPATAPAPARAVGDPVNGKAVFAFGNTSCTNCHGLEAQGGWGPDLAGKKIPLARAAQAIRRPIWRMPAFDQVNVTDKEILDMVAYWDSLPVAPAIGKWRFEIPANAPRGQQLAVNIVGCAMCHGVTLTTPRKGAAEVSGDFEWFKYQVYQHTKAQPEQWALLDHDNYPSSAPGPGRVRMGNYDPKRVPESILKEIWDWAFVDLGKLVPITARITAGPAQAAGTTYTVMVANGGAPGKGMSAEDLTVSLTVPAGMKVVSATGTGYQGVKKDAKSNGDVATWRVPKMGPREKDNFTITLAGTAAGDDVPRGSVGWAKPTVKSDALVNFAMPRPGGRGRGAAE